MRDPGIRVVIILTLISFLSCSRSPEAQLAKYIKRGDEHSAAGRFQEAVIDYKNAVKAVPGDANAHWKLAKAALEAKDILTAYRELQQTVTLDPGNYEALGLLGELYVASGKVEEAAAIADNLVKTRPQDPQGYILQSGLAVRAGKIDDAIAKLKRAAAVGPRETRTLLTIGNLYLLKRDGKSALEWYDKALEIAPESPDVHVTRGNFFFAFGDPKKGEEEYRKAIDVAQNKESIRIALAEHYMSRGMVEDGEKELNDVIKDTNSPRARKVLAEIRLDMGKVAEAKPIIDGILDENDKDLDGKYLKGRVALMEQRTDDAMSLFAEVLKQDGTMAGAHLYNGLAEIQKGRIEAGRKEIREAVRLDPRNDRARLILGRVSLQAGDADEAETAATEVLRRNPTNVSAALLLADSYLVRKKWKNAEQIYHAMSRQMPKSSLGPMKMGISRKLQGKPAEAAVFFAQARERNPADFMALNEYVFSLVSVKDTAKAKKTLEEAMARNPKNPLLWDLSGRFHIATGELAEGEAAFLKAIELEPNFVSPYYQLGMLYAKQKRYPEAESRMQKVVERDPRSVGGHMLLGVLLNSQGKTEEANREYRTVLDLSPKNVLAANNLAANIADGGGNLDEALKFAQRAREVAPEEPKVADTLGWVYYRKGLYESALPLLSEAAGKAGNDALIRYHYGMVLVKTGKSKAAAKELQAALSLDPKFPGAEEARKTLGKLR